MSDYAKIMVEHPANGGAEIVIDGCPKEIFACLSILVETISKELDAPIPIIFSEVYSGILKAKAAQSAATDERQTLN